MNAPPRTDPVEFLIVGQGLAGSLLAYCLIKQGRKVLVIDNQHSGSATKVAAGLINPITGHRLNITDRFFEFSSKAKKLYWQIERDLGCTIYKPIQQTRLIKNAGQADFLSQRLSQPNYENLLSDIHNTEGWFSNQQHYPYGAINISNTAVVEANTLLHCMRLWLQERDALKLLPFNYDGVTSCSEKVEYRDNKLTLTAKKIVFCEGHQAKHNPWLTGLPFKLSKGEVITIQPNKAINRMLNWGKWLTPLSNANLKMGSNYIWNELSLQPCSNTATAFLNDFKQHTQITGKLINHEVGIRPTTNQRKPFVGPLSNLANAYCFNGLGSKGCLIAPYYATLLCGHMLNGSNLPDDVTTWL